MPDASRLLIALPAVYFEQFVGDAVAAELHAAYPDVRRIDLPLTPGPDAAFAWQAAVRDFRPHALLVGWGTPAVPDDAVPPLGIVAHTAGEVRRLVRRDMIERGLVVTNWGPLASNTVAEHALLLTLASLRRLTFHALSLHNGTGWRDPDFSAEQSLYGRRVGLHGLGLIARQIVRLLRPFGCRITAYSAGVPDHVFADNGVAKADSLTELFAGSDVLIEAEALTDTTRNSVTAAVLAALPDGATFVNVGRGAVVDEPALIALALTGRVRIALDVYATEPLPPDSPLRGLPHVTLTPHLGGPTVDHRRACGRRAADALLQYAAGKPVEARLSLEVYDRST